MQQPLLMETRRYMAHLQRLVSFDVSERDAAADGSFSYDQCLAPLLSTSPDYSTESDSLLLLKAKLGRASVPRTASSLFICGFRGIQSPYDESGRTGWLRRKRCLCGRGERKETTSWTSTHPPLTSPTPFGAVSIIPWNHHPCSMCGMKPARNLSSQCFGWKKRPQMGRTHTTCMWTRCSNHSAVLSCDAVNQTSAWKRTWHYALWYRNIL